MPRFQITAEFDLTSEIEPDLYGSFDSSASAEDFSDNSYWGSTPVTANGGSLEFVIEAEDEDAAERAAEEVVSEGGEVEDRNGLTWLIESLRFDIEEIVPPLTVETAKLTVSTWLGEQDIPAEVKEALQFLLARVV